MPNRLVFIAALLFLLTAVGFADTLRVMSFNVRYPAKGDGKDRWEVRQDIFARAIRLKNPDLIGTQELYYIQGEFIVHNLPEYEWFGNSRRGNREDEHMGIFYKRSKLRVIESGNFWLSETPEVPGSQAWGASLPRMVTWALFEIRVSGKRFYHFNTHFHHTADATLSRNNSAKLIASRIAALPKDVPVILTGDFNTAATESEPYKILTERLTDTRVAAAVKLGPDGSMGGFGGRTTGRRIDWILFSGPFTVLQHETITYNEEGRYPSDHFPVIAVLDVNQ